MLPPLGLLEAMERSPSSGTERLKSTQIETVNSQMASLIPPDRKSTRLNSSH